MYCKQACEFEELLLSRLPSVTKLSDSNKKLGSNFFFIQTFHSHLGKVAQKIPEFSANIQYIHLKREHWKLFSKNQSTFSLHFDTSVTDARVCVCVCF